jgi:GDP-mannose 6-dehydrogenase
VFGLAFKENTDDLRESPVVNAIEQWIGKGRNVRVYDPHIHLEQIYGSNRNFILQALPHIERLVTATLDELIDSSGCIVIAQKPGADIAARLAASGKPTIDLVGTQLQSNAQA